MKSYWPKKKKKQTPNPMNAPSKKRLVAALGITDTQANLVRRLIRNEVKTTDSTLFPSSNASFDACYNMPSYSERLMECLNEVIQGHGVEALGDNLRPSALYVNTGDTYLATFLYSYKTNTVALTAWGDFAERNNL